MATVFLSPVGNDAPFYKAGQPLLAGKLYTYAAGTTTPRATYADSTGSTANANPIILNSDGYPAAAGNRVQVWLLSSNTYKFVLQDAAGVTQWTQDNVTGINDVSLSATEWVAVVPADATLTHIDTTNFGVSGDQRNEAVVERWVRVTVGGGLAYGIITDAQYNSGTGVTTVTIIPSGAVALDSGISKVEWGLLRPDHPSVPLDVTNIKSATITAAATTDIWSIPGNLAHITGTTGITSFGTSLRIGARRHLIFDSATPLTAGTDLVLPGGVSFTTAAGDTADVTADTLTKAVVNNYTRVNGFAQFYTGLSRVVNCRSKNNASTPDTFWDLTASGLQLRSTTNGAMITRTGAFTQACGIGTAGPAIGGRDQAGTFTVSTFVHFYWITRADNTLTAICSANDPTAGGPTLPTGYTHWAYDSSVLLDGSGNLLRGYMGGSLFTYQAAQTALNAGSATVETHLTTAITSKVPGYAQNWRGAFVLAGNADGAGTLVQVGTIRLATGVDWFTRTHSIAGLGAAAGMEAQHFSDLTVPNTGDGLYYLVTNTNGTGTITINITGFQVPNGS